MSLQTRYITADELYEYSGIDFGSQLKGNQNPSDKVNSFIYRVETRMEAYLNSKFFKRVSDEWPTFTDYQKEHYKLALLEQCIYIFRNGDIATDSGYEPESGIIASRHALRELELSPIAIDHLKLTGLWTAHIGYANGDPFWWGGWFTGH